MARERRHLLAHRRPGRVLTAAVGTGVVELGPARTRRLAAASGVAGLRGEQPAERRQPARVGAAGRDQRVQPAVRRGRGVLAVRRAVDRRLDQVREAVQQAVRRDVREAERAYARGVDDPARRRPAARSATALVEVCRPLPIALTTPTARSASGTSRLTSVDLPTPECPTMTETWPASAARRSVRSSSGPAQHVRQAAARRSSRAPRPAPARSALVRQSSGSISASYAATRQRSMKPVRGGGSASAQTITSWSALATMTRSSRPSGVVSSSSAVRRSTDVRSSIRTIRASASVVAGDVADDARPGRRRPRRGGRARGPASRSPSRRRPRRCSGRGRPRSRSPRRRPSCRGRIRVRGRDDLAGPDPDVVLVVLPRVSRSRRPLAPSRHPSDHARSIVPGSRAWSWTYRRRR